MSWTHQIEMNVNENGSVTFHLRLPPGHRSGVRGFVGSADTLDEAMGTLARRIPEYETMEPLSL